MITDLDALRDAAALARTVHDRDTEARAIVLRHADHEAVAEVLAVALVQVMRSGAGGCRHCVGELLDGWQADLRALSGIGGE